MLRLIAFGSRGWDTYLLSSSSSTHGLLHLAVSVAEVLVAHVLTKSGSTLQQMYPAEIMANDMRAKGMALHMFLNYAGAFLATYTTPIALENLGWRAYTLYRKFLR